MESLQVLNPSLAKSSSSIGVSTASLSTLDNEDKENVLISPPTPQLKETTSPLSLIGDTNKIPKKALIKTKLNVEIPTTTTTSFSVTGPSNFKSIRSEGHSPTSATSSIESGIIENLSKKKGGITRDNIILLDTMLRERRDIFFAMLNNVSKIRLYRKKRKSTQPTVTSLWDIPEDQGSALPPKRHKDPTGNEYIIKLNNGLKCEAYERSTKEDIELFGHRRPFKLSMFYTQNEMERKESEMMDPSPVPNQEKRSFLDQLQNPSTRQGVQTYPVINMTHPYHLFSTEMEVFEPKSGRTMGRAIKKTNIFSSHYLIQTLEGGGFKGDSDKVKYSTLFTLYKKKKTLFGKSVEEKEEDEDVPQQVLDVFLVTNENNDVVATIARKNNPDFEKKGYYSDYYKVQFKLETTPFERTLILASLFLLDIDSFHN